MYLAALNTVTTDREQLNNFDYKFERIEEGEKVTETLCSARGCGRKADFLDGYCVCHTSIHDKAEKFWREVEKILQDEKTWQYDFNGFVFVPRKEKQNIDYFEKYEFNKPVNFSEARFDYPTIFSETKFFKSASFVNARFENKVSFSKAEFNEVADFNLTKFKHSARFSNAKFTAASFSSTVFSFSADFEQAEFKKEAKFNVIAFNDRANFAKANFDEKADFSATRFESVTFSEAKFKSADFKQTTFNRGANFCDAAFETAHFNSAMFGAGADWTRARFDKRASFEHVYFLEPEMVRFHHTDLRAASFAFTDLRSVDFLNPKWATTKDSLVPWTERVVVYDEKEIGEHGEDYYNVVETIYRQLKYNYEEKRNYPEAGDFYVSEMEMRKKSPETPRSEKCLIQIYNCLSHYGESYMLAFAWIALLLVISSIIFMYTGITINDEKLDYTLVLNFSPHAVLDFIKVLFATASIITLQNENITTPTLVGFVLKVSVRIFGIIMIAISALALRRRFRR